MKLKKISSIVVGVILFVIALAAVILYVLRSGHDDSNPTLETEPNGTIGEADTLVANRGLAGFIVSANAVEDIDWYRLPGPGVVPWAIGVEVTGVPGLDMALQLVDPDKSEPITVANTQGQGGFERIAPMLVEKPEAYLMIQEVRAPGVLPGSFTKVPYQITYSVYDSSQFEVEPNNIFSAATKARLGVTMNGNIGGPEDPVDWYSFPAGTIIKTVQVSGTPGVDIVLNLRLGPDAREVQVNNLGPGQGEGVTLPGSTGPTRIAVGQRPITVDGVQQKTISTSYQILFQ